MKIGDLVKWSGWKYPILITDLRRDIVKTADKRETYYRCLAGEDYIWLFESSLEPMK